LDGQLPQLIRDDYYASFDLNRQPKAAKEEKKSRPVVKCPFEIDTTASFGLPFSGGVAIFAKSKGQTVQTH